MDHPIGARVHRVLALPVLAVAVVGAACSGGSQSPASSPTTDAPATTTTTVVEALPITVDWTNTAETSLPNGWTMRDCGEGGRTQVCLYDGDDLLGDIELLTGYPLDAGDDPAQPAAVALAWAARMVEQFEADRAEGCAGFTFRAFHPEPAVVGGQDGARSGFTLTDRRGREVERVVNHYTVDATGLMAIINTDAYALEGGCLGPSEDDLSFTPERLEELDLEILDRIVAGSGVPAA